MTIILITTTLVMLSRSHFNKIALPILALALQAYGSQTSVETKFNSPKYEAEATKLRAQPVRQYEFSKALLADVIRFLATDTGISFFSLPDGSPEGEKLVTFTLNASPFQALETLCNANNLALVLDGGIWFVRPADDKELIGRAYEVKHNAFERVTRGSNGMDSNGTSSMGSTGTAGSTGTMGSTGSTGSTTGTGSTGGVDLQGGSTDVFSVHRSELVNDIRNILDLGPETTGGAHGGSSPFAGGGDVTPSGGPTDVLGNVRKPKVLWKSDSNTLYVVATRLQHMWVEGYLAAADKPQDNIAIEVKFLETSRDPTSELGIDWTGTFGSTGTFSQFKEYTPAVIAADGSVTTPASYTFNQVQQTAGGFRTDMANLWSVNNLNQAAKSYFNPTNAVLSAQDVNLKLRALLSDQTTKTTAYPRMITTNNREVSIRSVINQPVLGGSTSASVSGGTNTTAAISYLPIGTVVNILPKKMEGSRVNLNIGITISSIVSNVNIQGNPYPVASSRVYGAPVEVNSGYTVAIGGLDQAREQETDTGIPVLSKIPILGYAFKTHSKSKNHSNLMIFITPQIIDPNGGGLTERPMSVLPRKPDALMPQVPRINRDGTLEGGIDAIPNAVAFMRRSTQELSQTISENRGTKEDYRNISDLKSAIKRLKRLVDKYITENPARWEELNASRTSLSRLESDCDRACVALMKKGYY